MTITNFREIAPSSLVEVDRSFRGAYCLDALIMESVNTCETTVKFRGLNYVFSSYAKHSPGAK
jgi:hypothetical protein